MFFLSVSVFRCIRKIMEKLWANFDHFFKEWDMAQKTTE